MNPKLFWLLTAFLLVSPHRAEAQERRLLSVLNSGKYLELLKEAVPKLSNVAILLS